MIIPDTILVNYIERYRYRHIFPSKYLEGNDVEILVDT